MADEYRFQELCRDILGKQIEEGVIACRAYEVRGTAQYGADVFTERFSHCQAVPGTVPTVCAGELCDLWSLGSPLQQRTHLPRFR